MRKYLTKFKLFLLVFVIVIVVVSAAFNVILAKSKSTITRLTDKYFTQELSIGTIFYFPPNLIFLKNISMLETASAKEKDRRIFFIPAILARFSFFEFIIKRQLFISDVYFHRPKINNNEFYPFFKDNFVQIMAFIRSLPRRDIRLLIDGVRLDPGQKDFSPDYTLANFILTIKKDSVRGSGSMCKARDVSVVKKNRAALGIAREMPLRFKFSGLLAKGSFSIENLEFIRSNLYSKLWGTTNGDILQLNGFAFINTLFKDSDYQESASNIIEKFKSFLLRFQAYSETFDLPKANLYILDIDCLAHLSFPQLEIENLSLSVNNAPIKLKGTFYLSDPIQLDLAFSSFPEYLKNNWTENLTGTDLRIKGTLQDKVFNGSGSLNLDFTKMKKSDPPLKRVEFGFRDLTLFFAEYPRLKIGLGEADLFCGMDSNTYKIFLQGFSGILNLQDERVNFFEFHSLFYDGILEGQGRCDMAEVPSKIDFTIRLKNVSANKLDGILIHFSKVYGRLSSQMYFSNYPELRLKGGMRVQRGYLKDFEFLKWLADFLGIPSLRRVNFNRAFSSFSVDAKGASLYDIDLESGDLNLGGYFSLGENDLVSSKLSLCFSRKLMRESKKLKSLLQLLRKDLTPLDFDFHLSGNLHAMNFQWLESDFKIKLQDAIPDFIQRQLERNVEDVIESISGK